MPDHTALLESACIFFALWPHSVTAEPPAEGALITVRHRKGWFTLSAPWIARPLREPTPTCLLCNLGIELISAFRLTHPQILCLHAAAVTFASGTVLLLGDNRAGKSSLAARLMADGHTLYADDLVGLTPDGQAFSFGIAPRLRLPLPPSSDLAEFVRQHTGPCDGRYQYVAADPATMAPCGTSTPIRRAILLQRHSAGKARLVNLPPETIATQLAGRCFMQQGDAGLVAEQATQMAGRIPFLCLHYADLDDAARYLAAHLDTTTPPLLPEEPVAHMAEWPRRAMADTMSVSSGRRLYRQTDGAQLVCRGANAFLCTPDKNSLYSLNGSGRLIWQLLQSPVSAGDVAQLLQEAYPHIPAARLQRDVNRMFAHLEQAKLIIRVSDGTQYDEA